jgi:hypothetical protein
MNFSIESLLTDDQQTKNTSNEGSGTSNANRTSQPGTFINHNRDHFIHKTTFYHEANDSHQSRMDIDSSSRHYSSSYSLKSSLDLSNSSLSNSHDRAILYSSASPMQYDSHSSIIANSVSMPSYPLKRTIDFGDDLDPSILYHSTPLFILPSCSILASNEAWDTKSDDEDDIDSHDLTTGLADSFESKVVVPPGSKLRRNSKKSHLIDGDSDNEKAIATESVDLEMDHEAEVDELDADEEDETDDGDDYMSEDSRDGKKFNYDTDSSDDEDGKIAIPSPRRLNLSEVMDLLEIITFFDEFGESVLNYKGPKLQIRNNLLLKLF